jgi:hypothetical protein
MNKFDNAIEGLKKQRAADNKTRKILADLEILDGVPAGNGKKHRFRLPYSSDPPSFGEPWKR